MALLQSIERQILPAGLYQDGDFVLPASWAGAKITINRFAWPDTGEIVLRAKLSVSDNNFVSQTDYEIETYGGDARHPTTLTIPNIYNKAAKMRTEIELFTDLDLSVDIEQL